MKALTLLLCCFVSNNLSAQSFEPENQLETIQLNGEFSLRCSNRTRIARCHDDYLLGGSHQYFVFDTEGTEVHKLTLTRTTSRGTKIKKKTKFRWKKGRSRNEINLWVNTLFQRALLEYGENEISYSLSDKENTLFEGTFIVNVTVKEERTCRFDFLRSYNDSDCNFPESLCDRYYRRNNYCK